MAMTWSLASDQRSGIEKSYMVGSRIMEVPPEWLVYVGKNFMENANKMRTPPYEFMEFSESFYGILGTIVGF